jgi:2-dehydro-3-deoxyphosphogluconate aldolase/(4S)-4-hydroxy-2-oxoglutarate aldolase
MSVARDIVRGIMLALLPTGGITPGNAAAFVQAGAWGLGIGSALVDPHLVAAREFRQIQERAAGFIEITAQMNRAGVA